MPAILARHDDLMCGGVDDRGGVIVKHTGDGVLAVFGSARCAVSAALVIKEAIEANDPGNGAGPLRIKMALHTGEPQRRDGDYFGEAVNLCARMLAAAGPGQVLLSLAAEELVRHELPADAGLLDLGEHLLPDIDRPEHLFQLTNSDFVGHAA
jgi:class 3 adenylate cyclase